MLQKVIWSIKMMNRCLFSYLTMFPEKQDEILEGRDRTQIILDKPLPFINGELAPAKYFYSLFSIKELNSKDFKPKIFLVIDEKLGGREIKIGELVIIKLLYIDVSKK